MTTARRNQTFVFALALALLAAAPAAADEKAPSVNGIITLNGQPLPLGKITFHLDDGQFVGSKIKDGTYKVGLIPKGQWRVTVEGRGVPAKYASEKTSSLTVTIVPDINTLDFDIKR